MANVASITTNAQDVMAGGLVPHYRVNEKTGKTEEVFAKNKETGRWHRVLEGRNQFGQSYLVNSILPEDAWKSLEAAVVREQSVPTAAVQHLRDMGLVIGESPFAVQHEWDIFSEVTAADITIDGEAQDERDLPQTFRKAITVPVVSKTFRNGFRALGAYNSTGRNFRTDLATEAAQVVRESLEDALFNGYGDVKLATASETYGYLNNPDANTAASGGDWGTAGNAETTVRNMISQLSADNYDTAVNIYVPTTQYNEIALSYPSVDNNITQLQRILNFPQVANVYEVKEQFLTAGTVLGVAMMRNVVAWVEAMPFTIVEWQSADGMSTFWRVMTIAAPRTTSTYAGRSGIVISTGN